MRAVLAILISAVLAAASPSVKWPPKDLTPEENLGSVGLNFTLMSRDEYLEKRQPGGVSMPRNNYEPVFFSWSHWC